MRPCDCTIALVFPIDVLQVKPFVALADVATKGVDAFPEPGTHSYSCCTLIHICKRKNDTDYYTQEETQINTYYTLFIIFPLKLPFRTEYIQNNTMQWKTSRLKKAIKLKTKQPFLFIPEDFFHLPCLVFIYEQSTSCILFSKQNTVHTTFFHYLMTYSKCLHWSPLQACGH